MDKQQNLQITLTLNKGIKYINRKQFFAQNYPLLKELPDFTDSYRVKKSLRYLILNKGDIQLVQEKENDYNVRGIFIWEHTEKLNKDIEKRTCQMIMQGMVQEILNFNLKNPGKLNHEEICLPIGYDEFTQAKAEITKFKNTNILKLNKVREKIISKIVVDQTIRMMYRTRQYSSYQRRYFKKNFNNLLMVHRSQYSQDDIVSKCKEILEMSDQEYKTYLERSNRQEDLVQDQKLNKSITSNIHQSYIDYLLQNVYNI